MDFSSTERALSSLPRRMPALSPRVISLANELLQIVQNKNSSGGSSILDSNFVKCTIELMDIGTNGEGQGQVQDQDQDQNQAHNQEEKSKEEGQGLRWEPLAVGLHLTASYLQTATAAFSNGNGSGNDKEKDNGNADADASKSAGIQSKGDDEIYMDGPRVPTITPLPSQGQPSSGEGIGDNVTVDASVNVNANVSDNANGSTVTAAMKMIDEDQLQLFSQIIMTQCQTHLEHNEPRVRSLVAKVVGHHTKLGIALLSSSSSIGKTIIHRSVTLYRATLQSLKEHLASGRDTVNKSKSSEGALDDTTGWRALETNLFCIGSFVHAAGSLYFDLVRVDSDNGGNGGDGAEGNVPVPDETLLGDVEYCSVTHVNRHVRAAAIALLEQLVHACGSSFRNVNVNVNVNVSSQQVQNTNTMALLISPEQGLRQCIVNVLKVTLADNWSQVRMAASVLCRAFYLTLLDYAEQGQGQSQSHQSESESESESMGDVQTWLTSTFPILLPRMCLNRFYLAQGVKLYSHDTWRMIFEQAERFGYTGGVESVALNAGPICRYYVKMCDADNHVVREAGCQAVAELATKLGRSVKYAEYLAPYVFMLLQALIMCFHDESWPVRDEACLACGTFVLAYPELCEPELPVLFSRWTEQLTDQIWSVREDAAVALGDAIEAYGAPMFDQVLEVLQKDLPSAKSQPAMTREEYKSRQNDIQSHTNSQLYSCGSLAPKLRKGGAGRIGCSDCLITRPKAPWEATDGCIYLIRELCMRLCTNGPGTIQEGLALTDNILIPIMTELADICRVRHFPQSDDLRTTLWKQLPIIAKALGKQRFKRHYLQMFLDLLIKNMENRSDASQLSVHAAGQCAEELASIVGVGIFRGRLEEEWQREVFDRTMNERRIANNQRPGPEAFSPFGPLGGMVTSSETKTDVNVNWPPAIPKQQVVPGNAQFESL